MILCGNCNGTGHRNAQYCQHCEGDGYIATEEDYAKQTQKTMCKKWVPARCKKAGRLPEGMRKYRIFSRPQNPRKTVKSVRARLRAALAKIAVTGPEE